MTWRQETELIARLQKEQGYIIHKGGGRSKFALVYPNLYRVGMSNLGIHIIYELLNARPDTSCERVFLPEARSLQQIERTKTPLLSLETQTPLFKFPIIAFAVSFEPDYFNVLKILELGRVKLLSRERGDLDPLVIAGGPCATFNPEPLSLFIDAFVIGEGEVVLPPLMDAIYSARAEGLSRTETLQRLAAVDGVYVPTLGSSVKGLASSSLSAAWPLTLGPLPSLGSSVKDTDSSSLSASATLDPRSLALDPNNTLDPSKVKRQWVRNLDSHPAHTVIVTDDTEFNMYLIETARGCGRHCRFCMAGYCFRRPRNRSLEVLKAEVEEAKHFGKKVGLMGAAISDYPQINELVQAIRSEGLPMSVASFRADSVTAELVEALVQSGLKTLTIAPEAGSAKMRAVINKGIEEEHIFRAVELGLVAGVRNFRLYYMIGLPFEELEDVEAIVELSNRLKDYMETHSGTGRLTLSVNPFIPKPFTPFQWAPMASKKYLEEALKLLRGGLKRKNVELIAESPRESFVQAVLARGDRAIAEVLLKAHENGGIKAFRQALRELNIDADYYLYRQRDKDEVFPWDFLDQGFPKEYLYSEYERAQRLERTPPCFDNCKRCGVCR